MTPQTEAEELAAAARALGRELEDIEVHDDRSRAERLRAHEDFVRADRRFTQEWDSATYRSAMIDAGRGRLLR